MKVHYVMVQNIDGYFLKIMIMITVIIIIIIIVNYYYYYYCYSNQLETVTTRRTVTGRTSARRFEEEHSTRVIR